MTAAALIASILLGPSPVIVPPPNNSSAAGVVAYGAGTCQGADAVVHDNNGVQGCSKLTDVAPQGVLIRPQPAFPGGTQTAADTVICGGQDESTIVIDDYAQCGTDTVTVTVINSNGSSTATILTEATDWTAATSNAATCTSLATAVDAMAGVTATCSTATVRIVLDPNTCSVTLAESDAACSTVGTGTRGVVKVPIGVLSTTVHKKATGTIADGDVTPDVSTADIWVTSANTGATAITDLDNPTVGQVVTLCGGSNTNSSTIADSGNFALNSAVTLSLDTCIDLWVQADNDYIELGRTAAGGWVGTATSNLSMSTFAVTSGTDPADTGAVRLPNDEVVCWEASPAGADTCIRLNTSEVFEMDSPVMLFASGGDTADAGILRLENAESVAWEASPAGTDVTVTVDSSEQIVATCNSGIVWPMQQADLTSSCTLGTWSLDTGVTPELCYCQATNTWYCVAFTDLTGPAD